jgi:hypothetical protein
VSLAGTGSPWFGYSLLLHHALLWLCAAPAGPGTAR